MRARETRWHAEDRFLAPRRITGASLGFVTAYAVLVLALLVINIAGYGLIALTF